MGFLKPHIRRRYAVSLEQAAFFLADLRTVAEIVPGQYQVRLVSKDPKDNPVVACALEGGADFIVTDDRKHLLPLKVIRLAGHRPIQIVSVPSFLRNMR